MADIDDTSGEEQQDARQAEVIESESVSEDTTIPPVLDSATIPPRRRKTTDAIPDEFDDYQVIEEIARGGMGIVYRVHQKSLDREVALKTVLAGRFASDEEIRLFHTEARAAGKLNHPGIVPVYDVGECHGFHYFSMPLIDGVSLGDRLTRGPIDPDEAATLMKAAAETVQFAHEHDVIHRDLKPGNILIDAHGQPLITDFGIAHRIDDRQTREEADALMGTAEYMSPEQASGEPVGPSGDVYSLGATLYCLLTGRPPFQSSNPLDTLLAVLESESVPPRRLNERIPRDLELICLKCLEKRPEARYASAREVAEELGRFLAGEPVLVHPVGNLGTFIRWTRRQPHMAALATGLVISFTAALGISVYYNFQLNMQRSILVESERSARLSEERARLLVRVMEELTETQGDVTRALEYSTLGELCATARVLSEAWYIPEREQALVEFRAIRERLSDDQAAALNPLLDEIEQSMESQSSLLDDDVSLAERLVAEARSLWRSATEDAPALRAQIRTVLYSQAHVLIQNVREADDRQEVAQSVESLQDLMEAELLVVADADLYGELVVLMSALETWFSGPLPETLQSVDELLEQAIDELSAST